MDQLICLNNNLNGMECKNSKIDNLPPFFLEIVDDLITVFIDLDKPYDCLNNELFMEIAHSNINFYNHLTGKTLSAYDYIHEHIFINYG